MTIPNVLADSCLWPAVEHVDGLLAAQSDFHIGRQRRGERSAIPEVIGTRAGKLGARVQPEGEAAEFWGDQAVFSRALAVRVANGEPIGA